MSLFLNHHYIRPTGVNRAVFHLSDNAGKEKHSDSLLTASKMRNMCHAFSNAYYFITRYTWLWATRWGLRAPCRGHEGYGDFQDHLAQIASVGWLPHEYQARGFHRTLHCREVSGQWS